MENTGLQTAAGQNGGERWCGWVCRPLPWALVFLLGVAARFRQYLANPSYWYDEAFLTVDIYDFSFLKLLGPLPGRTIVPPFFLWLLRGCYEALGPAEWALRLPAFVAGIAALLLMIPLARRWLGSPGWLWAIGFCALSTHCVNHAFEVRPYATDFLSTVAILLQTHAYLNALTPRDRFGWGSGLLLTSALAPWLSFTSIFVLAAASAAVFLQYLRRKGPGRLIFWLGLNGLLLLTTFLVWAIQARHLYYPGLKEEWTFVWDGFPRDYSPGTLVEWTVPALTRVAGYASTGLGVPLLLLGSAGLVRCWRRSKAEALLVAGPAAAAYLACLAGKYPLADRTTFFLAPCVWLLAIEGLLVLARRLPASTWAVPVVVMALMAPGLVKTVKLCARVAPKMEYREALVFVHDRRAERDAVWNWCVDLNTVYFDHVFCWRDRPDDDPRDAAEALQAARSRSLWVIAANSAAEDMARPLRSLPVRQTLCRQFLGVKVLRFDSVRSNP